MKTKTSIAGCINVLGRNSLRSLSSTVRSRMSRARKAARAARLEEGTLPVAVVATVGAGSAIVIRGGPGP